MQWKDEGRQSRASDSEDDFWWQRRLKLESKGASLRGSNGNIVGCEGGLGGNRGMSPANIEIIDYL